QDPDSVQFIRIDDSSFYDIKYKGDVVTDILRHSISSDGNELRVEILNPKSGNSRTLLHSRRSAEAQSGAAAVAGDTGLQRFAGTWKEDTSKTVWPVDPESTLSYRQNSDGSLTQTSASGTYKRDSTIWLDGKSHVVKNTTWVDGKLDEDKDDPGLTNTWIEKGPSAWEQKAFRDGKLLLVRVREIGPDNRTLTETETEYSQNGTSSQSITVYQRTTNTTAFLGTWKPISARDVTPDVMEISFDGDGTLNWHEFALDYRFSAKFDGKDYPVTGPAVNPKLRETLMKIDDHAWEDIVKDGEKPSQVRIWRLSPDGNAISFTNVDLTSSTPLATSAVYNRSVMQRKAE
ncbi:MAG TPA: hypothetical protein VLI55_03885, partial [Bryobacteraceae bacterium]|nr:hypothetical protein [Bryobacteraceae bacterium]